MLALCPPARSIWGSMRRTITLGHIIIGVLQPDHNEAVESLALDIAGRAGCLGRRLSSSDVSGSSSRVQVLSLGRDAGGQQRERQQSGAHFEYYGRAFERA